MWLTAATRKVQSVSTLITRSQDDVLIVYFRDVRIIDEPRIQSLGRELLNLVDQSNEDRILLSFRNVKFMTSSMIGKVILLSKKCKEAKIDLRLCEVSENIMEVFQLMKLTKILDIQKDEDTALKSFEKYKKKWYV